MKDEPVKHEPYYPHKEIELRENNPSVKHAWEELAEAANNYSEYRIKIRHGGERLIFENEQEHLSMLNKIALEKQRNYSFISKLTRDY